MTKKHGPHHHHPHAPYPPPRAHCRVFSPPSPVKDIFLKPVDGDSMLEQLRAMKDRFTKAITKIDELIDLIDDVE